MACAKLGDEARATMIGAAQATTTREYVAEQSADVRRGKVDGPSV
jgi:hypothetical protein